MLGTLTWPDCNRQLREKLEWKGSLIIKKKKEEQSLSIRGGFQAYRIHTYLFKGELARESSQVHAEKYPTGARKHSPVGVISIARIGVYT